MEISSADDRRHASSWAPVAWQWRRADTAISSLTGQARQTVLIQYWLRDSLRSLTPVEDVPFEGSDTQLSGISLNPALSSQGGATPVVWRIEPTRDGTQLLLEEQGQTVALALPDAASAQFSYSTRTAERTRSGPRLGEAMLCHWESRCDDISCGESRVWAATIAGIRNPGMTLYEPAGLTHSRQQGGFVLVVVLRCWWC